MDWLDIISLCQKVFPTTSPQFVDLHWSSWLIISFSLFTLPYRGDSEEERKQLWTSWISKNTPKRWKTSLFCTQNGLQKNGTLRHGRLISFVPTLNLPRSNNVPGPPPPPHNSNHDSSWTTQSAKWRSRWDAIPSSVNTVFMPVPWKICHCNVVATHFSSVA